MRWREFLHNFLPEPGRVHWRERALSGFGALLAVLAVVGLSPSLLPAPFYVIAAVGASSVLIFALPASALAQPWSVFGGYIVSAAVGVAVARWVPHEAVAAGLAVGGAIVAMLSLRCLHAPAGAVALFAVIGGETVRNLGYFYVLSPVAANAALLVVVGVLYNNLVPGRRYPRLHPEINPHQVGDPEPLTRLGLQHEELRAAIEEYGRPLHISGQELDEIMQIAERRSRRRQYVDLVCGNIMSRDVRSVRSDTRLLETWRLMRRHRLTVLTVVDPLQRVEGVVTLESFIHGSKARTPGRLRRRLYELLRLPLGRDQGVSSIMARASLKARPETHVADLVPAMTRGLHQVPVVDENDRLVGIVTQSDVIAALYHACGARP